MQVLDFVPRDYIQKKLARNANLLCALLGAVVVLVLTVLFVAMGMAEDSLQSEAERVDGQVAQASKTVEEWNCFQSQRVALLEKAEKGARLLAPLPRSRILAEVVRRLPEQTSLTELSIAEETVRIVEAEKETGPGNQSARRRKKAKTKEHQQTRVHLLGLAPTDVEVAQFIAGLSNSPYFDQVELSFSEDQAHERCVLRRFEVVFFLSVDAYRLSLASAAKAEKGL